MMLDDETLMAYADGESEHAAEIEAALAMRPMLAARVAEMRALRRDVFRAFAPVAAELVPAYLAAQLRPPRKVHVAAPPIIKHAPAYPFVALSAAAMALIACIVAAPNFMPAPQPRAIASVGESAPHAAPAIASIQDSAPAFAPPELVPLLSSSPTPVYAAAVWVQQPDAATIERYYPARAAARNISGKAVLDCLVNADGSFHCAVGSEEPGNWGFGAAAMEVARHFLVAEKAANGMSAVDGRLSIPITFAPRNCIATPSPIALGGAMLITNPIWLAKPSIRDREQFYPQRALESAKPGHAVVRCLIALDGALTNCVTTSETPSGWGFGDAALKMAQEFRSAPQSAIGEPTAGRVVDLPITFKHRP